MNKINNLKGNSMKKKSVVIFLGLIMTTSLLFVGCSNEVSNGNNTKVEVNSKENQAVDMKEEPETSGEIGYEIINKESNGNIGNYDYAISYPEVINLEDKQVEEKVKRIIEERFCLKDESIGEEGVEEEEDYKQTLTITYEITKKSKDILSIKLLSGLLMEGAAYPSNYLEGITFDMNTGEEITLENLFKKDAEYKSVINEILNRKINELEFELSGGSYDEFKGIEEEQGFYLTTSSIVFIYQEEIYAPHAVGIFELEISFEEIKDILK